MPKSVDGDIRLTVEIDASAVDKGHAKYQQIRVPCK